MRKIRQLVFSENLFPLLLLAVLVILTYFDLIKNINGQTFGHDLEQNWVYATIIKNNLTHFGQYTLWLPGLLSGFPLDTSNIAGIFYPFHALFLFLPVNLTFNLLTIIHIYLIGFFSFYLTKKGFKLSTFAALIAATSIMLSPKLMNHNYLGHFNLIESIPWVILAILLVIKSIERKSILLACWGGLSLALAITVFSIFYVYAFFAIAILTFVLTVSTFLKENNLFGALKTFIYPAIAFTSSLIFSSVFVISFLQFSAQSLRSRLGFWEGAFPNIYPDNLNQLLFPLPTRFYDSETLIYIGLPTLLLALIAIIFVLRKKEVIYLTLLSIFALTVAFGPNEIFYKIYYRVIPLFHFTRAPLRIWILFIIGVGILAGFGFDYLVDRFPKRKSLLFIFILPIIFFSVWIYNRDYLIFTNYTDHISHLLSYIPKDNYRTYCLDNCLVSPNGLVDGYNFSSGSEVVLLSKYYDLMHLAGGYNFNGYSLSVPPYQISSPKSSLFEKQNPDPKLLGLSSTKYVVSPYELTNPALKLITNKDNYFVYENALALPNIYTVPNATYYQNITDLKNGDFNQTVYLQGSGKTVTNPGELKPINATSLSPNEIVIDTITTNNSYLVITDTYFPGWVAKDNGREVKILTANGDFKAIPLPAGKHHLEIVYNPWGLKIGFLITSGSLLLLVIATWRNRTRKVKSRN